MVSEDVARPSDFSGRFVISEFIDHFGINRRTWALFLLLGFAMLFEGYDSAIVNYTLPSIQAEWSINSAITGSLSSWSLVGLVLGGVFAGVLSDRFGRKRVLVLSIAWFGLFNLPLYFSGDWMFFAVFRVLAGVGLGACIPIVTTSLSEWVPSRSRGFFITFGMAWMTLGMVVAGFVGSALCDSATAAAVNAGALDYSSVAALSLPFVGGAHMDLWRVTYFIGFLPIVYALVLHAAMPETPGYLAARGDLEGCVAVLRDFERRVTGDDALSREFSENQIVVAVRAEGSGKRVGPSTLFSRRYLRSTLAIWIGYFCGCMMLYGNNAFLPKMCGIMGYTYSLAVINMMACFVANTLCGYVADRVGRKTAVCLGFATGVACVALAAAACFNSWSYWAFVVVVMVLLGFTIAFGQTAIQPMMPEAYPVEIRGTGVAWCQAFGRLGGAIGPIMLGMAFDSAVGAGASQAGAMGGAFLLLTVPGLVACLAVALLARRDMTGRNIEEA